jgi:predicted transcriptional regulator of viral defense system
MNYLTLQRELKELELEIFTLNDIIKITEQTKEVIKSKLTILVKQKKVFRLKKGYYSLNKIENKFQLQKIYKNTYIALYSALEYYESTTQRFNNLDLITKNILKKQETNKTIINFHKVKKELFFGYEKIQINNTKVFISSIEKTIIDCIYFSSKVYLTEINTFIKKYKKQITIEIITLMLNKINSSILNKRTGYLLELQGIQINGLKINNKYEKLNKKLSNKGTKNTKWKLIINEEL